MEYADATIKLSPDQTHAIKDINTTKARIKLQLETLSKPGCDISVGFNGAVKETGKCEATGECDGEYSCSLSTTVEITASSIVLIDVEHKNVLLWSYSISACRYTETGLSDAFYC